MSLNAWDVAGGAFIVKQAGGKITDFNGNDDYIFGRSIIAGTEISHNKLIEIIKKNHIS